MPPTSSSDVPILLPQNNLGPRIQIASHFWKPNGIAFEIWTLEWSKYSPHPRPRFAGGGYDRVECSMTAPNQSREIPITVNELSKCPQRRPWGNTPAPFSAIKDIFSQPDSGRPRVRFMSGMKPSEWASTNATLNELIRLCPMQRPACLARYRIRRPAAKRAPRSISIPRTIGVEGRGNAIRQRLL